MLNRAELSWELRFGESRRDEDSGTDHDCETFFYQEGLVAASERGLCLPCAAKTKHGGPMKCLLATTAVALLLGLAPALAAEDYSAKQPTGPGVSPEASKEATVPPSGSADTSGGAAEQSSAGPNSAAGNTNSADKGGGMPDNNMDPSKGAKEQSSAPPGSSAESTSKAIPSLGAEQETEQN